jgi:hypothetical protein
MQLQIELPETLAHQFCPHLDQSAEIIQAGLHQVITAAEQSTVTNQSTVTDQSIADDPLIESVPDVMDFLADLAQRQVILAATLAQRSV